MLSLLFAFLFASTHLGRGSHEKPQSTGYIDIHGTRLNYVVEGKGTPCLVIGSSIYYPRTFSKNLRKHFRLYFVDMRWFAKTYVPTPLKTFTIESLVAEIDQVRTKLKLDRMVLMGHSIHGSIAFEYSKRYPKNVSHLVMVGSPIILGSQAYEDEAARMWKTASVKRQKLQSYNWSHMPDFKKHPHLQPDVENYIAMTPKYWHNPEYAARWLWNGMTINQGIFHHLYQNLFANYAMFGKRSSAPVSTLAILGKYDYVIPYTTWLKYKRMPNLALRVLPKSGHTPQLEEPRRFDAVLLDWMGKSTRRRIR